MTRIERLETHRVTAALHTRFVTALRETSTVQTLVVRLIDSDGAVGWGEAPQVWRVTGESLASAQACVEGPLSQLLIGRDPADLAALWPEMAGAVVGNRGAVCAVDVALHDLAARRAGLTLIGLLGGSASWVPTDVTLSAGSGSAMAEAARDRVAEGFEVLKLKVGGDPGTDVSRVAAVREAAGPDIALRLDANQGWSPRDAVRVITALQPYDIELVEQPVAAADLASMAWVRDRVEVPVMADESVFGVRDLIEAIRLGAADAVNIKLAKAGGLTPARTMLSVAAEYGIDTFVGTMMETHLGVGAAAALAGSSGTTLVPDLDAAWWCTTTPYDGGMGYADAAVVLSADPGSGVRGWA